MKQCQPNRGPIVAYLARGVKLALSFRPRLARCRSEGEGYGLNAPHRQNDSAGDFNRHIYRALIVAQRGGGFIDPQQQYAILLGNMFQFGTNRQKFC